MGDSSELLKPVVDGKMATAKNVNRDEIVSKVGQQFIKGIPNLHATTYSSPVLAYSHHR